MRTCSRGPAWAPLPVLIAGLALGVVACRGPGPAAGPVATPPVAMFVGTAACAGCHPGEAAAHRASDHAHAMAAATPGTVLGDFTAGPAAEAGGALGTFVRRADRFFVRAPGPDGVPREFPVLYTLGVRPLQQYLLPLDRGRLQVFGLAWDTRPRAAGGQRWFAPAAPEPGGPAPSWTRRDQTWNFACAECHTTGLRKGYDPATDSYASAWAEPAVGCEACHGPGAAHVAWARDGVRAGAAGSGIPVSFRGDRAAWAPGDPPRRAGPSAPSAEVEACARCHARRQPIAPYEPGRPLLDTHVPALLVPGLYFPDGQIRDEVYEYGSFAQSRMYRAGVTCSDCHDPHSGSLRASGNALCTRCHAAARFDGPAHHHHRSGGEGARCVACHMPARTYMAVDPRRDHAFAAPRPDLSATLGTPEACTGCHRDRAPGWAAARVAAWGGPGAGRPPHFAAALAAARRGALDAEPRLLAVAADHGQPAIVRATALALLPEFATAAASPAVVAALGDPDAIVRLAAVGALDARPELAPATAAAPLLRDPVRAVRVAAARALAGASVLDVDPAAGAAWQAALAEAIASERLNADRPEAHVNLALLRERLGDRRAAEDEFRAALRLEPGFVPARLGLADLLERDRRPGEAERLLLDTVAQAPDRADALHALGRLRGRQGRWREAVDLLGRAAALAPGSSRLAHTYGVALHAAGRPRDAIAVLEAAHAARPTDREVLETLAVFLAEQGELARALAYAERLLAVDPDDAEARALVRSLRGRSGAGSSLR